MTRTFSLRRLLLSVGFVGFLPGAPGTYGSIVGTVFFLTLIRILPAAVALRAGIFCAIMIMIFVVCTPAIIAERRNGQYDHSWIVIDEVLGMFIALVPFLFQTTVPFAALCFAFAAFRTFDIIKPFGIGRIDAWQTPLAVLLDDVVAGLYTAIITQAVLLW